MRKTMVAMAICLVGGAANATLTWGTTEVYDSVTGLDWAYMQPANGLSLDTFTTRTDGKRLATAFEVLTLYADAGIYPLAGSGGIYQTYPGELLQLRNTWAGAVSASYQHSAINAFITAPDNAAVGYVGHGDITISYPYYSATADGTPQLYDSSSLSPYSPNVNIFGAALVSGPAAVFAVPEPSSVALMALGLVAIAGRRARGRRAA